MNKRYYMILGLAPMDGITDLPCRVITKKIFNKYNNSQNELRLRSEFMTSDGFLACPENVVKSIINTEYEYPIILQIFGGNETKLLDTALKIQDLYGDKIAGIELNTGCPANNVMKSGGGSTLLKDKKKTLKTIKEISKKLELPFSIKTRAGLNDMDKDMQLNFLVEASDYCNKISVHSRTLKELYYGEGDWNFIYNLKSKANKNCKIIGNGAIKSYNDIGERAEKNGISLDGIMIGQAAIGNPWIFTDHEPSIGEKIETAVDHLIFSAKFEIYTQDIKENRKEKIYPNLEDIEQIDIEKNIEKIRYTPLTFRKYFHQYVKGIQGGKEAKELCNRTNNIYDTIKILRNLV